MWLDAALEQRQELTRTVEDAILIGRVTAIQYEEQIVDVTSVGLNAETFHATWLGKLGATALNRIQQAGIADGPAAPQPHASAACDL